MSSGRFRSTKVLWNLFYLTSMSMEATFFEKDFVVSNVSLAACLASLCNTRDMSCSNDARPLRTECISG